MVSCPLNNMALFPLNLNGDCQTRDAARLGGPTFEQNAGVKLCIVALNATILTPRTNSATHFLITVGDSSKLEKMLDQNWKMVYQRSGVARVASCGGGAAEQPPARVFAP